MMTEFQWQVVQSCAVFACGIGFLTTLLVISIKFPEPTPFQYSMFRSILALASAGFATFIPGLLHVSLGEGIQAAGAIAVFVIMYFFSPAIIPAQRPANTNTGAVWRYFHEKQAEWKSPENLKPLFLPIHFHQHGPEAKSHCEQANRWLLAGRFQEALTESEAALRFIPSLPAALWSRAQALEHFNRSDEAISEVKKVIDAVPDFIPARIDLAMWSYKTRDMTTCLQQAQELDRLGEPIISMMLRGEQPEI